MTPLLQKYSFKTPEKVSLTDQRAVFIWILRGLAPNRDNHQTKFYGKKVSLKFKEIKIPVMKISGEVKTHLLSQSQELTEQQSRPDTGDSGKGAKSSLLPKMKNTRKQCEQSQFHL